MTTGFAKDQPTGFKNYLENIAIVGVSSTPSSDISQRVSATHNSHDK